ncbi:hypothetical protein KC315_g12576 [Hortaea werneckii]|uniref:NmrA-like domain-containing protein n=1 Tax=Hortaea werneckii TaxID=91943 RepID=A0A3M7C7U2_HORWE|nr:hypothetical protein KC315_g12576 [Hortaea werneckii]KAI7343617.1 hypothetical protein KC354_g15550 [Hortaea werneckii]RMY48192.1 hypothetical protein D0863_15451 [Hortaea werneckii]
MSKLLVVVGATGQQGRSVIHWFQQNDPSIRIRGLTRTPTSDAAASLASTGVDVVQADLNDFQSLQVAFKGASYIFAYTDTASIIRDLASTGKGISAGQYEETLTPPPPEFYSIEVQQGRNVANAAAEVPELERLVWSSLANVKSWSGGKYDQVFHFDAKAAVAEYMLEKAELESKVSCVLMGTFLTNAVKGTEIFRCRFETDIDGSKTAIWTPPFPASLPIPWVDVEKDTGAFVKALIEAPPKTQLLGVSEWMTFSDWATLWSNVTGVRSRFEDNVSQEPPPPSNDTFDFKMMFLQTGYFVTEFGYTGGDPDVVGPEELERSGMKIRRSQISDYMKREDWSKILQ